MGSPGVEFHVQNKTFKMGIVNQHILRYDLTRLPVQSISKKALGFLILLFFIWPFGAFLLSLSNYNRKESHIIVILFTGLFGYSMIAESAELDIHRVLGLAGIYAAYSSSQIVEVVTGLYGPDPDNAVDIYKDLVAFIVSRFTTNGNILFMVFGLIYGWIYTKSVNVLISFEKGKNIFTIILLLSFSVAFGLDQLAGVRFATAAYLLFFGIFNFLKTNKKNYLFIASLSLLIHFAYLSVLVVFILFLLINRRYRIIYSILIFSFISAGFFQETINQIITYLGGSIEERAKLYTQLEAGEQRLVWYVAFRENLMTIYALIFILLTKIRRIKLNENVLSVKLLHFSLMLLALSNFTNHIQHAGYRYNFVFIMVFMSYVYVLFNTNKENKVIRILSLMAIPFFLLQFLYVVRSVLFYSSPMLYIGNIFMIFFQETDQNMWQLLSSIF